MGRVVRASMVELMDRPTVNQVEDFAPMGLDRDRALLLVQSDAPEGARERRDGRHREGLPRRRRGRRLRHPRRGRGRVVRAGPAAGVPGGRGGRARCSSRTSAWPCRCSPTSWPGSRRSASSAASTSSASPTPATATPTRSSCTTRPTRTRPARARAAFEDILTAAIALGGTITGEHGVGRLKRDALPAMLGPDVMELNQRIKDALDPDGLLNPGACSSRCRYRIRRSAVQSRVTRSGNPDPDTDHWE